MIKKHSLLKSFGYAFEGLKTAFKNEANFRIQLAIAVIVLSLSVFLKFSALEMIILITVAGLILILELINTAIEILAGEEITPKAKTIKDISAAAVVIAVILSVIVGLLLFIPKIWEI
ncbi:diacylglycerol kinase family protein [Candidatus Parcubacteria bacterium]|nr:diacylglycerol kinase family protein [Patescibacteria group bacterium]MBU4466893.1 diacylglycerol kinase family protein [Patescibacteria group bacterium]MCG2688097.1 diacylglycerol kinase family protein [Candidatus Parcubacteria bacterium]